MGPRWASRYDVVDAADPERVCQADHQVRRQDAGPGDLLGTGEEVSWCPQPRRSTAPAVEGDPRSPRRAGPRRSRSRSETIRLVVAASVLDGLTSGRLERSAMPALPRVRYRSAHRSAVFQVTPKNSAARRLGQFPSTTNWARRRRWRGVKTA